MTPEQEWKGPCGAPIYENGKMVAICGVGNCQTHRHIEPEPEVRGEDWEQRFDKEVAELSNPFFLDNADGYVGLFGYKTMRGNEIFTVTDWGHIKQFIKETRAAAYKQGRFDEAEVCGFDRGFIEGLTEALTLVKEKKYHVWDKGYKSEMIKNYHRGLDAAITAIQSKITSIREEV